MTPADRTATHELPVLCRPLAASRRGTAPTAWWDGRVRAWLRNYHGYGGEVDPAEVAREWARGATFTEAAGGVISRIPAEQRRENPTPEDW